MRGNARIGRTPALLMLLAATSLPALATPSPEPAAPALVETADGPLRGQMLDGVRVFRGIPFAVSPLGELRWRAPQPATAWTEVPPALTSGSPWTQPAGFMPAGQTSSEDCLYLDVTVPETATPATPSR